MIGLSGLSDIQGSIEFFIRRSDCKSPSDLTSDCFIPFLFDLDRPIYLSWWSNITVHSDCSIVAINVGTKGTQGASGVIMIS